MCIRDSLGKVLKRSDMILRLLRQRGVLGEGEYQAALAQSPNVGRMQQKVDQNITASAVFTSQSSSRRETVKNPFGEDGNNEDTSGKGPAADAPAQQLQDQQSESSKQ